MNKQKFINVLFALDAQIIDVGNRDLTETENALSTMLNDIMNFAEQLDEPLKNSYKSKFQCGETVYIIKNIYEQVDCPSCGRQEPKFVKSVIKKTKVTNTSMLCSKSGLDEVRYFLEIDNPDYFVYHKENELFASKPDAAKAIRRESEKDKHQ